VKRIYMSRKVIIVRSNNYKKKSKIDKIVDSMKLIITFILCNISFECSHTNEKKCVIKVVTKRKISWRYK